jgi:heme-degrading monooxygenase HmoA
MSLLRPLDPAFPIERQLTVDAAPVVLVNLFTLDKADEQTFLKVWQDDAAFMKRQPGFISTQLHRAIGESPTYVNYAVWDSTAHFRAAFTHPEFLAKLSTYPSSAVASPHLFQKRGARHLRRITEASLQEGREAMIKLIHPVAGAVALLTIATFWLSTALSELFASKAAVTTVKTAIPWGFLVLIPALTAAGGTGFALGKGRRAGLVGAKIKRMPLIAANGILVLIPAALFLASKATAADFDSTFYAVQALELAAGATNIALLGLNMRDGLKMKGRLRRASA